MLTADLKEKLLRAQRNEITEHIVYEKLSHSAKLKEHAEILEKISREELAHCEFFKSITGEEASPDKFKIILFVLISKIFGLNFGLKLMEYGEDGAQGIYAKLREQLPAIEDIVAKEREHENALLALIDEDHLKYISSVVLGLNDALVEFTASLAGFTLALQNARLIGIVGLITGIAASTSMAASEYLSTKQEETNKNPLKASIYTGIAYIVTVTLLVAPYFLFSNVFFNLTLVIIAALVIIFIFTFYMSTVKGFVFRDKFMEMAGLSLSIAAVTFFIGLAIRKIFGVDM